MSKSMRIQVLMEPELLTKAKTYAAEHKLLYKNDSQLIRNLLMKGITELSDNELTIYLMRGQLSQIKEDMEHVTKQDDLLSKQNIELSKENEILKKNLEIKTKKKVKK